MTSPRESVGSEIVNTGIGVQVEATVGCRELPSDEGSLSLGLTLAALLSSRPVDVVVVLLVGTLVLFSMTHRLNKPVKFALRPPALVDQRSAAVYGKPIVP